MLLHRSEAWDNLKLLQDFDKFSRIQLFKSTKSHVSRSSFYLIAQDVKPDQEDALAARKNWLQNWKDETFDLKHRALPTEEELTDLLETFGGRIIELAEPIWALQKEGIEKSSWFKEEAVTKEEVQKSAVTPKEEGGGKEEGTENESAEKEEGAETKVGDTEVKHPPSPPTKQ